MLRWLQFPLITFLITTSAGFSSAAGGFIDTPDQCLIVERVEGANVHLKSVGKCNGIPGRAYLETIAGKVSVYVDGKFWKEEEGSPLAMQDVSATLEKVNEAAKTIALPANRYEETMKEEAEKVHEVYKSPAFQQRLADETQRLKNEMFGAQLKDYPELQPKKDEKQEVRLRQDERIYLFVSSSMPMATIRNYVASMARLKDANAAIVMRGFVDGMTKVGPTIAFISRALKKDLSCENQCEMNTVNFIIDPLLFRRYAIDRVPAVVFATGVKASYPEESDGTEGTKVSSYHTVFGDASLEYILEKIRRETSSASIQRILSRR